MVIYTDLTRSFSFSIQSTHITFCIRIFLSDNSILLLYYGVLVKEGFYFYEIKYDIIFSLYFLLNAILVKTVPISQLFSTTRTT